MMTQKGHPYNKLFNTSSDVRLMSCILPQLNILCRSLVKPYYTKMTIHLSFTIYTLRPFLWVLQHRSYGISSKQGD